jgi:hypothetical protein
MTCDRPNCVREGRPKYCSRSCAGRDMIRRIGREFFVECGVKSGQVRRAKQKRTPEFLRGYVAGWQASEYWFKKRHGLRRGKHGQKRKAAA